jgi:hypothetical protein
MTESTPQDRLTRTLAAPTLLLAVAAVVLSACGSSGETTTTATRPAVSSATANRLATLSDRIAAQLDDGDLCHAAHTADDLQSAVDDSDLPATLRPGVEQVAGDLVDQVNCPPPPAPPEPELKKKKPEKHKDESQGSAPKPGHGTGHDEGSGHGGKHGPPGTGGFVPPGQAKQEGGD